MFVFLLVFVTVFVFVCVCVARGGGGGSEQGQRGVSKQRWEIQEVQRNVLDLRLTLPTNRRSLRPM